jgi:FkbM family methyltransferase
MLNIQDIINKSTSKEFNNPLVIYGAGNTGKAIAEYLSHQGRCIVAFIDQNASDGQSYLDKPILSLAQFQKSFNPSSFDLLAAMHNRDVEMPPLFNQLSSCGFSSILTMVDYANAFPDDKTFRYWLSPRSQLLDCQDEIHRLYSILADDQSKHWVDRILKFRLTGDYSLLPTPDTANQYVPQDLPRWSNPLRFMDCGAYNGDTIELLLDRGYDIDSILAFEPDPENFEQLAVKFPEIDHVFLPCGVSSRNCLVNFSTGSGEASHQVTEGGVSVQMVRIDDVMPLFAPKLIKMDVEGGEMDALHGAHSTITKYKPGLAISLYHKPEDFWILPLLLESWNLGYKFYIRSHYNSSFDSVLYAI